MNRSSLVTAVGRLYMFLSCLVKFVALRHTEIGQFNIWKGAHELASLPSLRHHSYILPYAFLYRFVSSYKTTFI